MGGLGNGGVAAVACKRQKGRSPLSLGISLTLFATLCNQQAQAIPCHCPALTCSMVIYSSWRPVIAARPLVIGVLELKWRGQILGLLCTQRSALRI